MSILILWVYGYHMSSEALVPVKVSFSFYPADMAALNKQTVDLRRLGAAVRRGTVLRALIELTSETEMFAATVLLHRDYSAKAGPREADNVAGIPTVDLPPRLVTKLDRVVTELAAHRPCTNQTECAALTSSPICADSQRTCALVCADKTTCSRARRQCSRAVNWDWPGPTVHAEYFWRWVPLARGRPNSCSWRRAIFLARGGCDDSIFPNISGRMRWSDCSAPMPLTPVPWLFDELEKAHPKVFDLFIQMLDPGHVTLATGEAISLRDDYVAFTSNLGAAEAMRMSRSSLASVEQAVLRRVAEALRPEILARIPDKLVFARLTPDVQREIAELHLANEVARLKSVGFDLAVSREALEFLMREGFHPQLGARPLRQTVERQLQDAVVRGLFTAGSGGGKVVFDAAANVLRLVG